MKHVIIILLLTIGFSNHIKAQQKISSSVLIQKVHQGKLFTVEAEIYILPEEGKLIMHYTHPDNFITFTNTLGEFKAYFPDKNQIILNQNSVFSADNDVLFFFVTEDSYDLGLRLSGYSITDTRYEDALMITTWTPPNEKQQNISKAEIVYEEYKPIYLAYYNTDGFIKTKIFYSEYIDVEDYYIPRKITEFAYLSLTDSIVSRKSYFNIKTGDDVENYYFHYKIPANAEIIK